MANYNKLARFLGFASLGLGLFEVLQPHRIQKLAGVRGDHTGLIRMLGARELVHALLIFMQGRPSPGVWSRVAGDAVDLAVLGAALTTARNEGVTKRIARRAGDVLDAAGKSSAAGYVADKAGRFAERAAEEASDLPHNLVQAVDRAVDKATSRSNGRSFAKAAKQAEKARMKIFSRAAHAADDASEYASEMAGYAAGVAEDVSHTLDDIRHSPAVKSAAKTAARSAAKTAAAAEMAGDYASHMVDDVGRKIDTRAARKKIARSTRSLGEYFSDLFEDLYDRITGRRSTRRRLAKAARKTTRRLGHTFADAREATGHALQRPETRLALLGAAVLGITALDVITAARLSREGTRERTFPVHGDLTQDQLTGARTPSGGFKVSKSITINRPAAELYRFWRNFENLPQYMYHLERVHVIDDKRSHWVAKAPAGAKVEWDAVITEDRPDELIAWASAPEATVPNTGRVTFTPATGDRGTVVRVEIEYHPPAGALGKAVAKLFGEEPAQQVDGDLRRFKQVIETGEVVRSEGSPEGLGQKNQRPARPMS